MNRMFSGCIAFVILLIGCGLSAQQQSALTPKQTAELAQQAYVILEAHCGKCHGKEATGGFNFRDHDSMLRKDQLRRDNFKGARLYVRAILQEGGAMPPPTEKNPLTAEERVVLKAWVFAGGPEAATPSPAGAGKTPVVYADVLQSISQDLTQINARERPFMRYFTLTNLVRSGADEKEIKACSVGVSKLLNSLSWQKKITPPVALDKGGSLLRIDLRKYGWTDKSWQRLLAAYPYGVVGASYAAQHITEMTHCDLSYLRADWFVAVAAVPPLYHDLLDLPETAKDLETRLNVQVDKDVEQLTAARAGLQESGISRNNRVVERHDSVFGGYWRSYDFQSNLGAQNIFTHPLSFDPSGGEIIFNLPNGLQAYLLVDGKGNRIDEAPIAIVSNKANASDPVVHNGLTCMSCHTQGMRRFTDALRPLLLAGNKPGADYDRNQALALYLEPAKMNAFLDTDAKRFIQAVNETGAEVGSEEPLVALQQHYDSSLDLAKAAAEVGISEKELLARLRLSTNLNGSLGILQSAGGTVKRDAWEEAYGDLVAVVAGGEYKKPTDLKKREFAGGGGNGGIRVAAPNVTTALSTGNYRVRQMQIETNDMVYDRVSKRLYASIPGHVEGLGNTITVINPVTAAIEQSIPIGSEPGRMAISEDGRYLYVVLEGANAIRRLHIPTRKPDLQFPKGTVGIEDMKVPPGHPTWLVIAKFNHGLSPRHAGDSLFINGVERPGGPQWGPNVFFFSSDGNYAYGLYNELGGSGMGRRRISEAGWGDAEGGIENAHENADDVKYDGGFFYTSTGRIYEVDKTRSLVGTFAGGAGPVLPDSGKGRVFFLQTIDKGHWLRAFSISTLRPIGAVEIPDVHGNWGRLVSWNPDAFAFRTSEKQIFLLDPGR